MKLIDYFQSQPPPRYRARDALAKKCGTSGDYLRLIAFGHRLASPSLAKKINRATKGAVLLHDIRPDIWDKPKRRASDAAEEKA